MIYFKKYNYMMMALHAPAGAFIGETLNSSLLAFILGIISHFIMDIIPHGDLEVIKDYEKEKNVKKHLKVLILDAVLTITIIYLIFETSVFTNSQAVSWGIIGALLPDLLVGFYEATNFKLLKYIKIFHTKNHTLIKKDFSQKTGLILQLIVFIIIVITIL